jgi:hypothetical protein
MKVTANVGLNLTVLIDDIIGRKNCSNIFQMKSDLGGRHNFLPERSVTLSLEVTLVVDVSSDGLPIDK